MSDAILVFNTGSSSIKFAVFTSAMDKEVWQPFCAGSVADIGNETFFSVTHSDNEATDDTKGARTPLSVTNHADALEYILHWLEQETAGLQFKAVGHRVVHGGIQYTQPIRVDKRILSDLKALIPLAPLHQPHALHAIEVLMTQHQQLPQVACFDTSFHVTMPWEEKEFALPRSCREMGIRHYGFHGLSYEYITERLPSYMGNAAYGKIVIAHLGHGVSMCAVKNRQSIATTMSFSPLDGLPMGTRSGTIDPAIVLYLLQSGMTGSDIADLLYHQSGLQGLSGISGDMRTLLNSTHKDAVRAVDYFCYRVSRELGTLAAALGGLDILVFTGGIGEHAAPVRQRICHSTAWLGVEIDEDANQANALQINNDSSKVAVWIIPTDEEQLIAQHTASIIFES